MSKCVSAGLMGLMVIALANVPFAAAQDKSAGVEMTALSSEFQAIDVTSEQLKLLDERESNPRFMVATGGGIYDYIVSVRPTSDGGYVAVGWTYNYGAGEQDVFLLKYDRTGALEWARATGGPGVDEAYDVQELEGGGFVVTGTTRSFGVGSYDVLILKYTGEGSLVWARTIGSSNSEGGFSICETYDGGYVVCGAAYFVFHDYNDVLLTKVDSSGALLWTSLLGLDNQDTGNSVVEASDSSLVVAGNSASVGIGGYSVLLLKYNSTGSLQWAHSVGGSSNSYDNGHSIQETPDGGYLVGAQTSGIGQGEDEAWVLKFNGEGEVEWARAVGGAGQEVAHDARLTPDGGCVVGGWTDSWTSGSNDQFLFKLDNTGALEWARRMGASYYDEVRCVRVTDNGDYVFGGYAAIGGPGGDDGILIKTSPSGEVPSCPELIPISQASVDDTTPEHVVVSLDFTFAGYNLRDPDIANEEITPGHEVFCYDDPASVDWVPDPLFSLGRNFPNPFNPRTTIRFSLPSAEHVELAIFTPDGRRVKTLVNGPLPAGLYEETWMGVDHRGRRVVSGIYIFRMTAGPYVKTKKMSLVK